VLQRNPGAKVTAFAVWEPILLTDWKKPGDSVANRIKDARAKQFWDREHLVAKQLARDAQAPQSEPECCRRDGILWDLVAVYPPDAVWGDKMPPATLFQGPVVDLEQEMEAAIRKLQKQ
jgi:hypothetical protein